MNNIDQLITENLTSLRDLQNILGYNFANPALLLRAISHRSFIYENKNLPKHDNETLEFLGDAVIDLIVGSLLFTQHPEMSEGEMTKLRASLVQESNLAVIAQELELGNYLLLGKGEDRSGGRVKPSILSCAFEAVAGAIFVDSSYDQVKSVLEKRFIRQLATVKKSIETTDAKSRLQEITQQQFAEAPTYFLDKAEGPDHEKTFTISVHFRGAILSTATAKSKKAAEQKAAELAIQSYQSEP